MKYDEINDLIDSSDEIVENWRKKHGTFEWFQQQTQFYGSEIK